MRIRPDDPQEPAEAEISRLRDLALLDDLTGLANRRAFLERMQAAFERARAGGDAFSLVLMDLDGLKDINDTFGYSSGDRALQEFGGALVAAVRGGALVARIGGDEFAVVAEHPTVAEAHALTERLRGIAGGVVRRLKPDAPDVIISAAVGASVWGPASASVEAVFTAAESEMSAAKAAPAPSAEAVGAFRPRGRRALGEELRALLAMARQVTTAKGVSDLLRRVTEQAAALVGAESAAIALAEDGIVRIEEVWRDGRWEAFRSERPLGRGVVGRTVATGRPELHNSLRSDVTFDWLGAIALGLRAILTAPLRDSRGETFGVLALGNKRGNQDFQESDVGLAQAFADLAASAIENVRGVRATEEARAYQRALMEQARDAILVVDPVGGRLVDANLAMEQLGGYSRDELLVLTVTDLGLELDDTVGLGADPTRAPLAALPEGIRRKDGSRVPVELSASLVQTERGPRLLVILRDVRERLAAEAALRTANERLRALTEQAGDAIIRTDLRGAILDANAMAEQVFGRDRAALRGLHLDDLLGEGERGRLPPLRRAIRRHGQVRATIALRRAEGAAFSAEVSASLVGREVLYIVRDITERLAAEAETRRRNQELEARNAVAALLTESRDTGAALEGALPLVSRAGEMDGALVLLADEGGRLRLAAGFNVPPPLARVLTDAPPRLGERLTGAAAAGRTPIVIDDVATDPRLHWQETRDAGLRSLVCLPLVVDNRALGVLALGSYTPGPIDERQLSRLRAFADQIAVWLDSRMLLEAARVREQDARFLADLGESLNQTHDEGAIVERLAEEMAAKFGGAVVVLRCDAADRWRLATAAYADPRYTPDLLHLARSLLPGMATGLGRRLRPLLVDITATPLPEDSPLAASFRRYEVDSLITVPLSAGGALLGALVIANRTADPPLTQRHLALAQEVGQHAALAIANAEAYREAGEREAFLRSIMEQAAEAILVFDPERGAVIDANTAAEHLTGRSRAALIGLTAADLLLARDAPAMARLLSSLGDDMGAADRRTVRVRHADGRVVTALVNASRVTARSGPAVMALLRDVTAELAAQRQRERLLRKVRDEAERSRQLLALAERLTQAERPEAAIRTALEACGRLAQVGRAGILLWDPERRVFAGGDTIGLSPEEDAYVRAMVVDERMPMYAEILRADGPILVRDAAADGRITAERRAAMDVRATVVIPLRAGGELLGFLSADRAEREQPFSRRDVALLTGIVQQTATALAAVRARARAEEARDYLQTIMGQAADGIVVTDVATGHVADVSDRLCDMLGIPREAIVGRPLSALVVPEQRRAAAARVSALRRGANLVPIRRRDLLHADGSAVPVEISNSRVTLGGRDLLVAVVRDVRDRIETERQLRLQGQVIENMRDAVIALDRDGRVIVWNPGAEDLFGWTAAEMVGALAQDTVTAGGLPALNELVRRLAREPVARGDVPFARKDGSPMWCEVALTRMRDEQGAPLGVIGIVRDVTAQRQAEARLRTFALMVDNAGEAIMVLALDGLIVQANPAAHAILGYAPGELVGLHGATLLDDPGSPEQVRATVQAALRGVWRGTVAARRKDGSRVLLHGSATPLPGDDGRAAGVVVVAEDVTAEEARREEQRALLARLTEASDTASRRTSELRTVADMASILVSGGDPETVFAALTRRILDAGTFDIATISLYDAAREQISLRQIAHRLPEEPAALKAARGRWIAAAGLPILLRLIERRAPIVVHEGDELWRISTLVRSHGTRDRLRLTVAVPLLYQGEFTGTVVLYARADRPVPAEELRLLQALADQVAAAAHNAANMGRIRDMRRDAMFRLALACEARDPETGAHLRRLQSLTEAICRELRLPAEEVEEIGLAAVLHDVGKIAIPEAILRKEGVFTAEEREVARLHTLRGEEMLAGPEFYATARQIARSHHERWDGSGYPDGLAGLAIPRPARIVAVTDVYDALISTRVYKHAWQQDEAASYILDHAGLHFDPEVAAAFEAVWKAGTMNAE